MMSACVEENNTFAWNQPMRLARLADGPSGATSASEFGPYGIVGAEPFVVVLACDVMETTHKIGWKG